MLDLMRRHARSWLIKVALGGIILVFVFWYGWSGPGPQSQNYAAKVDDTIISYDQFYRVYESELEKIRIRFKGSIPPDLLEKVNLKKRVVEGMVHQLLFIQEADRLGFVVTDTDLATDIRSNPLFQRNGVFDEGFYRVYLNSIKMSPSYYEQTRKQELLQQQVVSLLTDSVKVDPGEIKKLWHFHNDKLVLSVLLIKAEEAADKPHPDQAALESYFKKNQAKYEIPQSLNLDYVAFSWRDVQKNMAVSDDEALNYFKMNPREFITPERIRAGHILLKLSAQANKENIQEVRKKAEEILSRIKAGEEFEKIAKAESQDESSAQRGGDLGFFSKGTMNPEMEKAAWKLDVGQISEPVLTEQGYHLIRLEEKKPETQLEFELTKDSIVKKLLEAKARKAVNDIAEQFYEKVYRTEDLKGQAEKFGLQVKRAEFVTKGGGIPDVGDDPKIMEEAFQLKTGETSRMLRAGDSYVLMKLEEKNKERIPELSEVRVTVEKDFLKEQDLIAARKKAQEVIQALKSDAADPVEVAEKFGLKWQQLEPVARTATFIPQLGNAQEVNEMLTTVTKAVPLFPDPVPVTGGVAVVRLTGVESASEDQYAKDSAAFDNWVLEVRKTEIVKGWIQLLESRSKVDINEKLM